MAKENDAEHLQEVLAYLCSSLLEIAELLSAVLPETAMKISKVFAEGIIRPLDGTLFPKTEE